MFIVAVPPTKIPLNNPVALAWRFEVRKAGEFD
jgi:hypothetical protein